jgi:cytochrome c biogenesis protein CcdA/thiol-disulfide isomerase/thioredoxin
VLLLIVVGFVAGLITGLSPCILPVLPVVFVAGGTQARVSDAASTTSTTPAALESSERALADSEEGGSVATVVRRKTDAQERRSRSRRPFLVVTGLVISFAFFTLLGSSLLTALHLPEDLLRDIGLVILAAVGVGLLVPRFGDLLERPFVRIAKPKVNRDGNAFVLGLGLGLVFVPCAGPVLAAITVVGASGHIGFRSIVLTIAFAAGVAVPLFLFALAGEQVSTRTKAFRTHAGLFRKVSGVVLIVMAIALAFNAADFVQRAIPTYTNGLQNAVEGNAAAQKQLQSVTNAHSSDADLANCTEDASALGECGQAPAITGISGWFNTPGNQPLTLSQLHGKVVILDFWTYSCINCQRTIPHLEAWWKAYGGDGLEIVGIHTPEFAFEHVPSNVKAGAAQLGVTYPVAIDNDYGTWNAYANEYWPAEYLIDSTGTIRHLQFGEGDYAQSEKFIRQLLVAANPKVVLPAATEIPDTTPNAELTPESYIGYNRLDNIDNPNVAKEVSTLYTLPASIEPNDFALGGRWTIHAQDAVTGSDATLALNFTAHDVYLVLGGTGTVAVDVNGGQKKTVVVSGNPRLYTLVSGSALQTAMLHLSLSPGVQAYAFTFG